VNPVKLGARVRALSAAWICPAYEMVLLMHLQPKDLKWFHA